MLYTGSNGEIEREGGYVLLFHFNQRRNKKIQKYINIPLCLIHETSINQNKKKALICKEEKGKEKERTWRGRRSGGGGTHMN